MADPYYNIEVRGDVLCAKIQNKTGIETDLKFVLGLATAAQTIRNRPWGILSDMREWHSNHTQLKDRRVFENFDRRNQIAECWIVRDENQGTALIPIIEKRPSINFIRVKTLDEAIAWYKKQPLSFDGLLSWENTEA